MRSNSSSRTSRAPPLSPSPADIQRLQSAFSPRHLFVEVVQVGVRLSVVPEALAQEALQLAEQFMNWN